MRRLLVFAICVACVALLWSSEASAQAPLIECGVTLENPGVAPTGAEVDVVARCVSAVSSAGNARVLGSCEAGGLPLGCSVDLWGVVGGSPAGWLSEVRVMLDGDVCSDFTASDAAVVVDGVPATLRLHAVGGTPCFGGSDVELADVRQDLTLVAFFVVFLLAAGVAVVAAR